MRILVVCQYYYPENVVISPMCEDLVRRGNAVSVITGKPNYGFGRILDGYEKISDEIINGVQVHRLPLTPRKKSRISLIRNYLSFWHNAKRYLAHYSGHFDLVYTMSMSPLVSVEGGIDFAKRNHIPCLIHCLDLWPESAVIAGKVRKGSLEYRFLYNWSRKIYSRADEILISSPSFASYFSDVLDLGAKKVVVVPQPPLVEPLPEKGVIYPRPFNLVYAGNIGNLQLIENYVLAAKKLIGHFDFQLHLIGAGSRLDKVLALIKRERLEEAVKYHSIVPAKEVPSFFVNATALIVPLADTPSPVSKTIPNKLISSLYYARPILASIGGDGHQVLADAGGAIFASEDPEDIAKAMATLFTKSEAERLSMGKKNRDYFEAHYDFARVMGQLENEFKTISESK